MRWFLTRVYRERRRIVAIALLTFLGGYITFFGRQTSLYGVPFPIVGGLAFMTGLTLFFMVIVFLFPKIRNTSEAIALSIPVLSLMGAFSSEVKSASAATSVMGILLCYLLVTIYGGAWVDRFLPRRSKCLRSIAISRLPPEKLWPYLATTPDTAAEYIAPEIISLEWIEPEASFSLVERSGPLAKIEGIHAIEVSEPSTRFRCQFEIPDAQEDAPVSQGTYVIRMFKYKHGTQMETTRESDRVTLRAELYLWIDDAFGRLDDEKIRRAEATELA